VVKTSLVNKDFGMKKYGYIIALVLLSASSLCARQKTIGFYHIFDGLIEHAEERKGVHALEATETHVVERDLSPVRSFIGEVRFLVPLYQCIASHKEKDASYGVALVFMVMLCDFIHKHLVITVDEAGRQKYVDRVKQLSPEQRAELRQLVSHLDTLTNVKYGTRFMQSLASFSDTPFVSRQLAALAYAFGRGVAIYIRQRKHNFVSQMLEKSSVGGMALSFKDRVGDFFFALKDEVVHLFVKGFRSVFSSSDKEGEEKAPQEDG